MRTWWMGDNMNVIANNTWSLNIFIFVIYIFIDDVEESCPCFSAMNEQTLFFLLFFYF